MTQSYDAAESLDRVLLRLKIEECRSIATRTPPTATATDGTEAAVAAATAEAAAYKPQTPYDNTPWRFDMSQNGRRMTADEFDAWMKAKGVRVARGRTTPAVEAPAATDTATESN
ncbi:MAG: hypothetical protein LBL59_12435 [Xanthomonadaceae bacterium]|nr:hypothetical protein [Xanthomonadaceae bacterium]